MIDNTKEPFKLFLKRYNITKKELGKYNVELSKSKTTILLHRQEIDINLKLPLDNPITIDKDGIISTGNAMPFSLKIVGFDDNYIEEMTLKKEPDENGWKKFLVVKFKNGDECVVEKIPANANFKKIKDECLFSRHIDKIENLIRKEYDNLPEKINFDDQYIQRHYDKKTLLFFKNKDKARIHIFRVSSQTDDVFGFKLYDIEGRYNQKTNDIYFFDPKIKGVISKYIKEYKYVNDALKEFLKVKKDNIEFDYEITKKKLITVIFSVNNFRKEKIDIPFGNFTYDYLIKKQDEFIHLLRKKNTDDILKNTEFDYIHLTILRIIEVNSLKKSELYKLLSSSKSSSNNEFAKLVNSKYFGLLNEIKLEINKKEIFDKSIKFLIKKRLISIIKESNKLELTFAGKHLSNELNNLRNDSNFILALRTIRKYEGKNNLYICSENKLKEILTVLNYKTLFLKYKNTLFLVLKNTILNHQFVDEINIYFDFISFFYKNTPFESIFNEFNKKIKNIKIFKNI